MRGLAGAFGLAALAALAHARGAETSRLAVKAANVIVAPGKSLPRGVILIEDGKIAAVGTDLGVPRGARVEDFGDATICAGFVDAHAQYGSWAEVTDTTNAFTPSVRAVEAFRPARRDWARAAAEGVTTVALAPSGENVIGGLGAVVKVAGKAPVLRDEAMLVLSLAPSAIRGDRFPTSFGGAIGEIERRFRAAGADPAKASGADARAMARARKELRPWIEIADPSAVRRWLRLAKELELSSVVLAYGNLIDAAGDLAAAKTPVVLWPSDFNTSGADLRQPAELSKAGVEIAIATFAPLRNALSMRLAAALAVANGLDRATALAAITTTPAKLLGVADRVGTLEAGRDADFVVFTGDPLHLASGVRATFVNGERVALEGTRP